MNNDHSTDGDGPLAGLACSGAGGVVRLPGDAGLASRSLDVDRNPLSARDSVRTICESPAFVTASERWCRSMDAMGYPAPVGEARRMRSAIQSFYSGQHRMTDFEIDTRSACMSVGAQAIEICDMLERLPKINTPSNQAAFPHEIVALSHALGAARAALLDFEQSVREARVAACEAA